MAGVAEHLPARDTANAPKGAEKGRRQMDRIEEEEMRARMPVEIRRMGISRRDWERCSECAKTAVLAHAIANATETE